MEKQNGDNPFGQFPNLNASGNEQEKVDAQLTQIVQENRVTTDGISSVGEQIEYAGFWVRFAALFVDALVLIVPTILLNFSLGKNAGGFAGAILAWGYIIYMLSTRQATLGKMAVGLKVTTANGGKPTVGKLLLREIIGKFLNGVTLCIGYMMVVFTQKKQGLHDKIADTVVIYDPFLKKRKWLVGFVICLTFIIPLVTVAVILFSLNTAKNKALEVSKEAKQKAIDTQITSQQENFKVSEEENAENVSQEISSPINQIQAENTDQVIVPQKTVQVDAKNVLGINTRLGYNEAVKLIEIRGKYELRGMIFTKYLSDEEKGHPLIIYTFYLENINKEVQVKYDFQKKKASILIEYDLNKPKEAALSSVLGKTQVPELGIDYGFEKAADKILANEDYIKIPNKINELPWIDFHSSPFGWEFQTRVETSKKEKYSFSVNLDKDQVFFEKRTY